MFILIRNKIRTIIRYYFLFNKLTKNVFFKKIVNYIKVSLQWVLVGVGQGPWENTADGTNLNIETSGASKVILLLGI